MMVGRAGGWMEWGGAVLGGVGVGIGVWGGGGARGEGGNRSILDCINMITVLFVILRNTRVL